MYNYSIILDAGSTSASSANDDKSLVPLKTSSCSAIVPSTTDIKPVLHHSNDNHHYGDYSHTQTVHLPEDTKPIHLSHEINEPGNISSSLAYPPHLKGPTPRSFHMDMRFNPYSRPPYPLNSVPSGFLPSHTHSHSHVYPPCTIPQAVFTGYQGSQGGYPAFSGSQGYAFPPGISTPNMVGSFPADTHTSSELHNMDAHITDHGGHHQ